MDDTTYWQAVHHHRLALADFLSTLSPSQWDAPSLCPDWRVRDVAGHLSLVPTVTLGEMMAVAPRAGFNPHRINTHLAVRYGSHEPEQIVARLREHAAARTTARGLDPANALFDILVHSQDIAIPLDLPYDVPAEHAVAGLERVWSMGWPFRARRRLGHVTLIATDAPWRVGTGPDVCGSALSLLLLATGRVEVAASRLAGSGVGQLR
jgi:uncharacterized protein (TIGR03083 family)